MSADDALWAGRPIVRGRHAASGACPHTTRVLGARIDTLGRRLAADWCVACGARTEWLSHSALRAADIEPDTLPVVRPREAA